MNTSKTSTTVAVAVTLALKAVPGGVVNITGGEVGGQAGSLLSIDITRR